MTNLLDNTEVKLDGEREQTGEGHENNYRCGIQNHHLFTPPHTESINQTTDCRMSWVLYAVDEGLCDWNVRNQLFDWVILLPICSSGRFAIRMSQYLRRNYTVSNTCVQYIIMCVLCKVMAPVLCACLVFNLHVYMGRIDTLQRDHQTKLSWEIQQSTTYDPYTHTQIGHGCVSG